MNILSRLRADDIGGALRTLPNCETVTTKYMEASYDVPGIGKVLFLCRRFRYRHGKSVTWFWTAENAILEDDLRRLDQDRHDRR